VGASPTRQTLQPEATGAAMEKWLKPSDSAGPVLYDEWLTKPLGQRLSYQTCGDVGRATSGKTDDDPHGPRRIGLRPCGARHGRQRGGTRGQMQKFATQHLHLKHPSLTLQAPVPPQDSP
jgi:hypothetical protein